MRTQSFDRFCTAYDFELTPAQRVLGMVCFDGIDPCGLPDEDRDLARSLFGDLDEVPTLAREVIQWLKGARVGGSRMASMRNYLLGHTVPLELAPGESAYGLFVGPDTRLARQAYSYAFGAAKIDEKAGRIAIVREGADSFTFERHDGHLITMECLPATRGGSAVRARSLVCAVMTAAAFFRDDAYIVNDAEIFRALAPRIVPGGQLILESTPWAQDGLVWDLFSTNHTRPTGALVAHCPTLLMRPDARTKAIVERERQRDPDNAEREFDALFMTGGGNAFFDPVTIDAAMGIA
jgi:hypothetical protein